MKILSLLLLPLLLFGELEVALSTSSPLKPIYLTRCQLSAEETDWRLFEDLRQILEFDLNTGGFVSVLEVNDAWEKIDLSHPLWQQQKIPFVCLIQGSKNRLSVTLCQVDAKTSKKYPDLVLSGQIDDDRYQIHRLSNQIHKDLFGKAGIAGMKILYAQRSKNKPKEETEWSSNIWLSDIDGANPRQLTHEKGYCLSPGFLTEKNHYFYVTYRSGQAKICKASFHQPQGEVMVSLRGNQMLPAFSPKGGVMAFITDVAGRPDLFLQPLDKEGHMTGKARQLFSAPKATQASPTFSPDGTKVAFVSDKDGPPRIYVLPLASDGKPARPTLLTKQNRENTSPAWSPDGKKIAYSAKVDGIRQIWIYNFENDEEYPLTTGPENKENPAWAPNSHHLVYNTESEESCELFLIHLNSSDPVKITKGPGQKRFPAWGLY